MLATLLGALVLAACTSVDSIDLACVPGERSCSDGVARACAPDGTQFVEYACSDPFQGLSCEPSGCAGPCARDRVDGGSLGCDFHAVSLFNALAGLTELEFGVAIANPSEHAAVITVTRGDAAILQQTVEPHSAREIALPWLQELSGTGSSIYVGANAPVMSRQVARGSYRIRSNVPIAAVQLNPMNPAGSPSSGGASLLWPVHAWDAQYDVLSIGGIAATAAQLRPDLLALTATANATDVTVRSATEVLGGPELPAPGADGELRVLLNAGDVLELFQHVEQGVETSFAGTRVTADKPLQAMSGNPCIAIDPNVLVPGTWIRAFSECDHLEESLLPSSAAGTAYLLPRPFAPGGGGSLHAARIVAFADGETRVEIRPESVHPAVTLVQGEALELLSAEHVRIDADRPIGVLQFLINQTLPSGPRGHTSQTLALPLERFRKRHAFTTPMGYPESHAAFVTATEPNALGLVVDGADVTAAQFEPVAGTGWIATLAFGGGEHHEASAEAPFAVLVYGYAAGAGYAYPAASAPGD